VASLKTKAIKKGDKYIVNGQKQFISHADVSKYICIACVTNPDTQPRKGLSILLVERETPGLSIGKREHKMGIRASTTCEVILEDVEVPAENILGKEGDGFAILMKTLDFTRPVVASQAVGIAQGALDIAIDYAKERRQFGQPIFNFQGLNWMLADMVAKVEVARQSTYKAAAMYQNVPKNLARVAPELIRLSAIAKMVAADTAMSVTTDAVQVLGGYGYIKEYPLERMMRDAKITQIYEGTSQIQKIVIAGTL
jgi:alkylation response protein AidB-like acyl-CoA dehydrogenase